LADRILKCANCRIGDVDVGLLRVGFGDPSNSGDAQRRKAIETLWLRRRFGRLAGAAPGFFNDLVGGAFDGGGWEIDIDRDAGAD
jgi:hypothetical protein